MSALRDSFVRLGFAHARPDEVPPVQTAATRAALVVAIVVGIGLALAVLAILGSGLSLGAGVAALVVGALAGGVSYLAAARRRPG